MPAVAAPAQPADQPSGRHLPYATYSLVTADGRPLERQDKHPFAFSRVAYSAAELQGPEAWAQLADGTCRWRQSAGEVRVIVAAVPSGLPARRLHVDIQPYWLSVRDALTGRVYCEGDLERGVVPGDSTWTQGSGDGEDGCLVILTKMNLELVTG